MRLKIGPHFHEAGCKPGMAQFGSKNVVQTFVCKRVQQGEIPFRAHRSESGHADFPHAAGTNGINSSLHIASMRTTIRNGFLTLALFAMVSCAKARRIFLILIFLLTSATGFCQGSFVVTGMEENALLTKMFEPQRINHDGTALWKPNFAEAQEFNVWQDGLCYTRLDTILLYDSSALLVFTTLVEDSCHVCAPDISLATFSIQSNKLYHFEHMKKHLGKFGSYGNRDAIKLRKAANGIYLLDIEGGYFAMGETTHYVAFYDLQSFEEVFTCILSCSFEDALGKLPSYSWERKLSFISSNGMSELDDIALVTNGTAPANQDDVHSPIRKISSKEVYTYDEDLNRYIHLK
ncbi:MAG TPA: hypothetical protein VGM92_07165 [Candidatus Kapabacteria bacterium]|jgi:hypothetical protein